MSLPDMMKQVAAAIERHNITDEADMLQISDEIAQITPPLLRLYVQSLAGSIEAMDDDEQAFEAFIQMRLVELLRLNLLEELWRLSNIISPEQPEVLQ